MHTGMIPILPLSLGGIALTEIMPPPNSGIANTLWMDGCELFHYWIKVWSWLNWYKMTDFLFYFQNHLKTEMNPFPVSIYHPIIFTWGMLMILEYCL